MIPKRIEIGALEFIRTWRDGVGRLETPEIDVVYFWLGTLHARDGSTRTVGRAKKTLEELAENLNLYIIRNLPVKHFKGGIPIYDIPISYVIDYNFEEKTKDYQGNRQRYRPLLWHEHASFNEALKKARKKDCSNSVKEMADWLNWIVGLCNRKYNK